MVIEKPPVAEIDCRSTWDRLAADRMSQLIDVRTQAEWTFVGVPDLSQLGKEPILLEWQTFGGSGPDPDFAKKLNARLQGSGIDKSTNLFFICRSGARSRLAAQAMAALGYGHCHNVSDGFEGPLGADPAQRHRGKLAGWKVSNLSWQQS